MDKTKVVSLVDDNIADIQRLFLSCFADIGDAIEAMRERDLSSMRAVAYVVALIDSADSWRAAATSAYVNMQKPDADLERDAEYAYRQVKKLRECLNILVKDYLDQLIIDIETSTEK